MDFATTGNLNSGKKALRLAGARATGLADPWQQLFQPVRGRDNSVQRAIETRGCRVIGQVGTLFSIKSIVWKLLFSLKNALCLLF